MWVCGVGAALHLSLTLGWDRGASIGLFKSDSYFEREGQYKRAMSDIVNWQLCVEIHSEINATLIPSKYRVN